MEKQAIHRFYHEHELILTKKVSGKEPLDCYGCGDPMSDSECAYVCTQQPHCSSSIRLHKRCAELPRQLFSPPSHPQCVLNLFYYRDFSFICNICRAWVRKLGYQCRSCNVDIHTTCAEADGMEELIKEKRVVQHPSHPHPLTLMRKPAFSFTCDGCGTRDVDMAYICSPCEFWLHKACASFPAVLPQNRHRHHHKLSLALCFPIEHYGILYPCDVCLGYFDLGYWSYKCGDCRYLVHLQCIDATQFPLHVHDISNKLITPFIMREMPDIVVYMPEQTSSLSEYHQRPHLNLVSEAEDDDDLKICDVCVTPISHPPDLGCVIHPNCNLLPKTLSASSLDSPHIHGYCQSMDDKRHKFTLCAAPSTYMEEGAFYTCNLCHNPTNGMVYQCKGCETNVDVKCASLPTTIKHESHSHHKRLIMTRIQGQGVTKKCHGCRENISDSFAYCCISEDCDFALDFKCALHPLSITKREWDKHHQLLLTFDVDASDSFCEICEEEMHPEQWVYHCRHCDYYFHPHCFMTLSGRYRNIKFGREFVLEDIHRHPLTFNCVTLKKRCDICHGVVHNYYGLECLSCYYVVCFACGFNELIS